MPLLRNVRTNRIIATRVVRLSGFLRRAVGLLGRRSLEPTEGAWIGQCNAIHTIGMRVPIDVIFLDNRGCVVRLESCVLPNRPALVCRGAKAVVELGSGALYQSGVAVGDYLEMS